ncbi:MAG: DNA polymerase IV [Planctomycetota bacterium]|nr:MAG: DNA polymerase IV [Planctomycetota bacterium]
MPPSRSILHVDMDAFFASVEQLDRPELRGKAVLVGGDGPRGVVAAASYEARAYGCHSAQPMAIALRDCPSAIVVPPRGRRYHEISEQVFEILESYTPLVQPLSIDEAFLDVTGSRRLHGPPRQIAVAIRKRIAEQVGVTASVGVAPNKFLAKLASDMDKPDGLTVIDARRIEQTLADLPIGRMWGVGPATEQKLGAVGITTFGDLQHYPADVLASVLGTHAGRMVALSRGEDDREVVPDSGARSISQEQTFAHDVEDAEAVRDVLLAQCEHVGARLRRHGLRAGTVTVKIRYGDFETITRSQSFGEPTNRSDHLWSTGRRLFDRWASRSYRPVRLIGFGAGRLSSHGVQLQLFTAAADERRRRLDEVTDTIQDRFGRASIHRGGRSGGSGPSVR